MGASSESKPAGPALLILDSPAFLQLHRLPPLERELLTTPQVVSEAVSAEARIRVAQAAWAGGKVRIAAPGKVGLARAGRAAARIGETKLSAADMSVLALALETGARVATDDYALQNACRAAGVGFVPLAQKGIASERKYSFACIGCGKAFPPGKAVCDECGNPVERRILRGKVGPSGGP